MPTIRKAMPALAAGQSVNILQGDQYEYLPFNARVQFAVIHNSTATQTADVSVFSGSDVLQQGGPPTIKAVGAVYPDDFLLDDVAAQGERLNVQLRNTGTAAWSAAGPGTAGGGEVVARITPL